VNKKGSVESVASVFYCSSVSCDVWASWQQVWLCGVRKHSGFCVSHSLMGCYLAPMILSFLCHHLSAVGASKCSSPCSPLSPCSWRTLAAPVSPSRSLCKRYWGSKARSWSWGSCTRCDGCVTGEANSNARALVVMGNVKASAPIALRYWEVR